MKKVLGKALIVSMILSLLCIPANRQEVNAQEAKISAENIESYLWKLDEASENGLFEAHETQKYVDNGKTVLTNGFVEIVSTDERLDEQGVSVLTVLKELKEDSEKVTDENVEALFAVQVIDKNGAVIENIENLRMRFKVNISYSKLEEQKLYKIGENGSLSELKTEIDHMIDILPSQKGIAANVESLGVFLVTSPYFYGDINDDGDLTSEDALEILKIIVKSQDAIKFLDDRIIIPDVNGDEKVTADDALLLLKKVVGVIDQFPVEAK